MCAFWRLIGILVFDWCSRGLHPTDMKNEYDFTNSEQGKFYVPIEELDIPIYLDEEVKRFFVKKLKKLKIKDENFSLNDISNALLLKDIEISRRLGYL